MEHPVRHQRQDSSTNTTRLRLQPVEDYLGQWLTILADHYPSPAWTMAAAVGYRVGLETLTPEELDLAFSETFKRHPKDFRPTAGEVQAYLRTARFESHAAEMRALPEAGLTDEQARELLEDVRSKLASFKVSEPKTPPVNLDEIHTAESAVARARKEINRSRSSDGPGFVLVLTEEELRTRKSKIKAQAMMWDEDKESA